MVERKRLKKDAPATEEPKGGGGLYFASPSTSLEFINTGCKLLDLALGGGLPLGRVSNVVGDKSTGKTLQAIEASANFARAYPKGKIFYREAEAAFDKPYASALGMPLDRVDFGDKGQFFTLEEIFKDLIEQIKILRRYKWPGLYIIDSLDALSDDAELDRNIGDATYGTGKAKAMSELFRRVIRDVEASRMHLMIISQVRDKIGVTFGKKTTRSGGRALDFYASQVLWLSHVETVTDKIKGVKRATGIRVRAKVEKNKVGLPFRSAEYTIRFGYGIDSLAASVNWLKEVGRLDALNIKDTEMAAFLTEAEGLGFEEYGTLLKDVDSCTASVWKEIEVSFLPKRAKYA